MKYDVIVVGGGHNGMVAAFYLARAGMKVHIVEQRPWLGGVTGPLPSMRGYATSVTNSPGSLEPKIVEDMRLRENGLRFVRPDPTVVVPFSPDRAFVGYRDQEVVRANLASFSKHDSVAYYQVIEFFNDFAKKLGVSVFAPPPRFHEMTQRITSAADEEAFSEVMFGSIKDFLDHRLESDEVKTILAMLAQAAGNVGPSTPGSPIGLLSRPMSLASSQIEAENDPRRQPLRGSTGLPIGGMRAVVQAMENALKSVGVSSRVNADVTSIITDRHNRVRGIALETGEELHADIVLSSVNPKTTLLDLAPQGSLPDDVLDGLQKLKMDGAAFKIVLGLNDVPRFAFATDDNYRALASCQFRIGPSVEYLDRSYDDYKYGKPSVEPKLWGLVPSVADPTVAPEGKHVMSLNVWYAPYHLKDSTWSTEKGPFVDRCLKQLGEYMPNLPHIIDEVMAWSPLDLETEFGLLEGHQLHGDMTPGRMFSFRPTPHLSQYRTPIEGLYLCGAGAWPGGFVTGLPGHNASHEVLKDLALKRGRNLHETEQEVGNRL